MRRETAGLNEELIDERRFAVVDVRDDRDITYGERHKKNS
jgi:hypothetical protein